MNRHFGRALAAAIGFGMMTSFAFADKTVFEAKCGSCHGKDGKGKPPMAKMFKVDASALDLTSPGVAGKSDEELLKVIADGKNKMPSYGKQLKPEEQKSVLNYMRSLAPKGAEAAPPAAKSEEKAEVKAEAPAAAAVSDAAKAQYEKSCASCHGKDGKGNPSMVKVFKVDPSALDMTDDATLAKSNTDLDKVTAAGLNKMPAYKGKMPDSMISELTAYIRSLKK